MAKRQFRILNPDGTFNVSNRAQGRVRSQDLYHSLLTLPTWRLFLLVLQIYLGINAVFALAYFSCGPHGLEGSSAATEAHRFLDCFFFSVQTFATIGYGKITPTGMLPNLLVTLEALVGLLSVALMTGIIFARFARPTARVIFSRNAVISAMDGELCFVCRIANERLNQIVNAEVTMTLIRSEKTAEGEVYRNFYDLKLERSRSVFFSLSWTLVHPITPDSPLHGLSADALREVEAEIMVSLSGLDEALSSTIHARHSYIADEIVWGGRFVDILNRSDDGMVSVDLPRFHDFEV